jgi:hypothetical protein
VLDLRERGGRDYRSLRNRPVEARGVEGLCRQSPEWKARGARQALAIGALGRQGMTIPDYAELREGKCNSQDQRTAPGCRLF